MAANFLLDDVDGLFRLDISFKDNKLSQICASLIRQRPELKKTYCLRQMISESQDSVKK